MKFLQDLWILNDGGLELFRISFDPLKKTDMFGEFLSALCSFAQQLFEKGLTGFELEQSYFFIKKENSALFIATTDKKSNKKKAYKEFETVNEIFLQTYPQNLYMNWNGDSSLFEGFSQKIQNL